MDRSKINGFFYYRDHGGHDTPAFYHRHSRVPSGLDANPDGIVPEAQFNRPNLDGSSQGKGGQGSYWAPASEVPGVDPEDVYGLYAWGGIPSQFSIEVASELEQDPKKEVVAILDLDLATDPLLTPYPLVGEDPWEPKKAKPAPGPGPGLTGTTTVDPNPVTISFPGGMNLLGAGSTAGALPSSGTRERLMGQRKLRENLSARAASSPLPSYWPSVRLVGTKKTSHDPLIFPAFTNVLISDHRSQQAEDLIYSTRLADLESETEAPKLKIDANLTATLSSVFSVQGTFEPDGRAVALHMARAPGGESYGRGFFVSDGWLSQGAPAVEFEGSSIVNPSESNAQGQGVYRLAYAGEAGGGPLGAGAFFDKHRIGFSDFNLPINQGHLILTAPWFLDAIRDAAPKVDTEDYVPTPAPTTGFWHEALLRYDPTTTHIGAGPNLRGIAVHQGQWRWQVRIPEFIPDPVNPPYPPDGVGGGDEPGGGDPPGGGGDGPLYPPWIPVDPTDPESPLIPFWPNPYGAPTPGTPTAGTGGEEGDFTVSPLGGGLIGGFDPTGFPEIIYNRTACEEGLPGEPGGPPLYYQIQGVEINQEGEKTNLTAGKYSWIETVTPGISFFAYPDPGHGDLLHTREPCENAAKQAVVTAPRGLHLELAMALMPYTTLPSYTLHPSQNPRYAAGTVDSVLWVLPPEIGLENINKTSTTSNTTLGFLDGVSDFGVGTYVKGLGKIASGYTFGLSSGDPVIYTKDSSGDTSITITIPTDISATVETELEFTAVQSSTFDANIGDHVLVDSSGGAFPVYLPDATECRPNTRLAIKDSNGSSYTNPVLVVSVNSQTLDGVDITESGTPYELGAYQNLVVKTDGSNWYRC